MRRARRSAVIAAMSALPLVGCSALVSFGDLEFDQASDAAMRDARPMDAPAPMSETGIDARAEMSMDVTRVDVSDVGIADASDASDPPDSPADLAMPPPDASPCTGTYECHRASGGTGGAACRDDSIASCLDGFVPPHDWCGCGELPAMYFVPESGTGATLQRVFVVAPFTGEPYTLDVGMCAGGAHAGCPVETATCGALYRIYSWDVSSFDVGSSTNVTLWQNDGMSPCCGTSDMCDAAGSVAFSARWMPGS